MCKPTFPKISDSNTETFPPIVKQEDSTCSNRDTATLNSSFCATIVSFCAAICAPSATTVVFSSSISTPCEAIISSYKFTKQNTYYINKNDKN